MQQPGRLLVGHPFNPPHIIPLVEVVPGLQTPHESIEAALSFYRALGKAPQVIHKEIGSFVANRLQAAIFRECVSLVAKGVVRIEGGRCHRHAVGGSALGGGRTVPVVVLDHALAQRRDAGSRDAHDPAPVNDLNP